MTLRELFRIGMVESGVAVEIVNAIELACENAYVDPHAASYAGGMIEAFAMYQVAGVKMNVLYMLGNMVAWQGIEARATKKILKKWSSR